MKQCTHAVMLDGFIIYRDVLHINYNKKWSFVGIEGSGGFNHGHEGCCCRWVRQGEDCGGDEGGMELVIVAATIFASLAASTSASVLAFLRVVQRGTSTSFIYI